MNDNIKLSVIIPVYNSEKYLSKCLDSVINQDLSEIEIICVDDASDDNSLNILESYKSKYGIKLIKNKVNCKAGISRNKGMEIAKGEYLLFLDADDYLLPNVLYGLYNQAHELNVDILRARAFAIDNSTGEKIFNKRYEMKEVPDNKLNKIISFKHNENIFLDEITVAPWAGIVKREYAISHKIKFNNLTCVNDRSFYINSILNTERIVLYKEYIVCHTTNNSDSLISKRKENFNCQIESYYIIKEIISKQEHKLQAIVLQSELRDLLSWFKKFSDNMTVDMYNMTKEFLKSINHDIELIRENCNDYIIKPWYKICMDVLNFKKEEYQYRNYIDKDNELYKNDIIKTRNKVLIHELINFNYNTDQDIKVSIIVPVYNVSMYLKECLDSIVAQTLKEIEIICVNDGSTDNSLEILKEYAAKDVRIKVIDKDNAGYGHTMNLGIDMAKGEYIGIVESDDYITSEMYENLYMVAKKNNADIVKSDFNRFKREGNQTRKEYFKICEKDSDYNRVIKPFNYLRAFWFVKNTWSGIYKREFLKCKNIRHNETPGASYQDNGFWFKTFAEAERCYFINKAFYMNRRDNPNSSVYNKDKVYCMIEEFKYIREYLESNSLMKERYIGVYHARKLSAYKFSLSLIRMEDKKNFLKIMHSEYKEAEMSGELVQSMFTTAEWTMLHHIIRDSDDYFYSVVKNSIKVSVIIPIYNAEPYLKQCLDSYLAQTLKEIEIICIDDGSDDNSLEIIKSYSLKDRRVICISQQNKGAGYARNIGIKSASGKYLYFPDADDFADPTLLSKAYTQIRQQNAEICVFGSYQYDNESQEIKKCNYSIKKEYLPGKKCFSCREIKGNPFQVFMGWAWDKLYNSSFVLNNSLYFQEQRTTNDMYFVFTSILRANKITVIHDQLYYQRRNNPNSLSSTRSLSWECFYHALKKVKKELENMGIYEAYQQDYVNYALHSCLWNLNTLPHKQGLLLFDKLRTEWFSDLGIEDYGREYYKDKLEYDQFQDIMKVTEDLGEPSGYWSYSIYRIQRENQELREEINKLNDMEKKIKISEKESLTVAQLIEKLKWNRKQREILEKTIKNSQNTQINKNELDGLKEANRQLIEIRKSFSYRIGLVITWIPRKIRSILT